MGASSEQTAEVINILQDRIVELRGGALDNERILIALAGIPGSGKSTIAAKLLDRLHQAGVEDVAVVPMDGYHYSKAQLNAFPDPQEAYFHRGAAFTYDADAFVTAAKRLQKCRVTTDHNSSRDVLLPSFDHAIQDPVDGGIVIKSSTKVVILEGNYVLLNQAPWTQIAKIVQDRWFVSTSRAMAKERLVKRHLWAGIETSVSAAEERVERNDLRNADFILASLSIPDVVVPN